MDLEGKTVWRVGAGDGKRRYDEICTRYDVMMIGPGERGRFDEQKYADFPQSTIRTIRQFYKAPRWDDIVLLRLGSGEVLAVGEIADDAVLHVEEFGDIDGWRLQHVRRVRWFEDTPKNDFPLGTFRGRFRKVKNDEVCGWLKGLEIPDREYQRQLASLPNESEDVGDDKLRHRLSLEGLPSQYVDGLTLALRDIRRLATVYWNERQEKLLDGRPSEQETISHLVLPLLFALGWSHETVAIEWNEIDVALFKEMPSDDSTLGCVIEVKALGGSVFKAIHQAIEYATHPGRDNCQRVIITDGIRYSYFSRGTDFKKPHAYLNIRRMREKYPVYDCGGAVEAIMGIALWR